MPGFTSSALTISCLGCLLSPGYSHERPICSAIPDGDVTGFSYRPCGNRYWNAALDDYCRVAMVANQRRGLSGIGQTLAEGNGNTVCGRRSFGNSTLVRVGIALARFHAVRRRDYRHAVLARRIRILHRSDFFGHLSLRLESPAAASTFVCRPD